MPQNLTQSIRSGFKDLTSALVVFLVALPLCLGIALASNAPLFSGILAGIIGGLLVGLISGSQTSVSGPAAGLTAIVAAQINNLGSFETFLLAVMIAGIIQIIMGTLHLGFIATFFPSSVIKGLLAAIGVILVLKQIPHVIGHDSDANGEMSFFQPDHRNTFTELLDSIFDIQPGAALIGLISLLLLVGWGRVTVLKKSPIPSALVVVVLAIAINSMLRWLGTSWTVSSSHLVQITVAQNWTDFLGFFRFPNFSQLNNPTVYTAAFTIAIVASLETLLNLEAIDKIDPQQRRSPPNRELIAQGIGNLASGLVGGLPMTSVIVRSSVNISAGSKTKLSAILHGVFLLTSVLLIPNWLNQIPLAALAAILIMTGFKLANPKLLRQMWSEGRSQFLPFIITVVAIIFSDLLIGILVGLASSILFILSSNFHRPIRKILEKHIGGDVLRIELANQVSFLNRPVLEKTLHEVPRQGHVLIDARNTDYIDPDILDLIEDFKTTTSVAHEVQVSLIGFKKDYLLKNQIQYVDFSSRDVQSCLTPERVLKIFQDGNARFLRGERLTRDLGRQVGATSAGQFPMGVVLSCIDSRTPAEMIFDLGLGDIFCVRVAGNIARDKVLGSLEYSCAVAGAKLILVMGHTSCGAVNAAVDLLLSGQSVTEATGCNNLEGLIVEIQQSINLDNLKGHAQWQPADKAAYRNEVARRNVIRTMGILRERSTTLNRLALSGKIAIVGGLYDIKTGHVAFFQTPDCGVCRLDIPMAIL